MRPPGARPLRQQPAGITLRRSPRPAGRGPRLRDLGGVFRIPSARAGLIATAIVFTAQFAASTYIIPLLTEHARMSAPLVTALFFGYGTVGLIGTLTGGRVSPAAGSAPSPALPWQSAPP